MAVLPKCPESEEESGRRRRARARMHGWAEPTGASLRKGGEDSTTQGTELHATPDRRPVLDLGAGRSCRRTAEKRGEREHDRTSASGVAATLNYWLRRWRRGHENSAWALGNSRSTVLGAFSQYIHHLLSKSSGGRKSIDLKREEKTASMNLWTKDDIGALLQNDWEGLCCPPTSAVRTSIMKNCKTKH